MTGILNFLLQNISFNQMVSIPYKVTQFLIKLLFLLRKLRHQCMSSCSWALATTHIVGCVPNSKTCVLYSNLKVQKCFKTLMYSITFGLKLIGLHSKQMLSLLSFIPVTGVTQAAEIHERKVKLNCFHIKLKATKMFYVLCSNKLYCVLLYLVHQSNSFS